MMRRFTHLLILCSCFFTLQAEKYDETFFNNLEWRNIGPNRGGRSLSSMGSPGRPNEYYFGATGGGLWKTTDGGNTWFPVTDGKITSSSIGAVAVAETNPDIVYIGGGRRSFAAPSLRVTGSTDQQTAVKPGATLVFGKHRSFPESEFIPPIRTLFM